MKNLLLILLLVLSSSCGRELDNLLHLNHWITYTIYKGEHYSTRKPEIFAGKTITFKAEFNESAIYTSKNPVNQYDINKLYGACFGSDPLKNSARFGWVWNTKTTKLEIWAFYHIDGKMYYKFLSNIDLNRTYEYELKITKENYRFTVAGCSVSVAHNSLNSVVGNYYLFPFFGGNEVAPHRITIRIKETSN